MAQHAHAESQHPHSAHDEPGYEAHTHHGNYWRIWGILCGLLAISVAGPFFGHPLVTLITAFGIAIVKAWMVAKNFMHITVAPRYVAYLIGTCLLFMLLFFAGTSPDVMRLDGTNWAKPAWKYANEHVEHVAPHHGGEAAGHEGAAAHE